MLLVTSAERDSGKTTLLGLVNLLSPRGLMIVDPSPAVLYRLVEKWKPTLVVDEADDQFKENPPLRAVVNSGWTRGAGVPRCNPDTNEPEIFSTFGPKAIGMKGRAIPDTTLSRSIVVEMVRKRPGERAADFEHLDDAGLKAIRQQLARWAGDNIEALRDARPTMPEDFHNRLAANWRPLLAIADLAGGEWPRQAREAAVALAPREADSIGTTLLADIRSAFDEKATDRLASADMCEALAVMEGRPWAEWKHGKPLTPNQLARMLKPFGVASENLYSGGGKADSKRPKGYYRHRFDEAWQRYVAGQGVNEPLNRYTPTAAGTSTMFQNAQREVGLADQKCEKPLPHSECSGLAVQKGVNAPPRVCAHCGAQDDGHLQPHHLNGGEPVWLHPECVRFFR
jgi:hypothetical protein